jgi:hypothetical protein
MTHVQRKTIDELMHHAAGNPLPRNSVARLRVRWRIGGALDTPTQVQDEPPGAFAPSGENGAPRGR